MSTYTPNSPPIDHIGGRGDPPVPPMGGGDNDAGRGSSGPDYGARLRRARVGVICAIVTVSMIFVSLTSAYVFRRGLPAYDNPTSVYVRDWIPVQLPWLLLAINTALLLISSVTMEFARRSAIRQAALAPVKSIPGISIGAERTFPWLGVTAVLGVGFLVGQWLAWSELRNRGFYVNSNPSGSFVYLLTATHATHLFGGIVALIWAATASLLQRPIESRRIVIDISAWYWHFMAVLWVYVFALLAIVR
jgi:cytochrome c oxidase subunit 3